MNPFKKNEREADEELFVVYDSKAGMYGDLNFAKNKNVVIRELLNMMKDPKQQQNKLVSNAEDFSLFSVGKFYRDTGEVTAHTAQHCANLHDLRAIAQPSIPGPGIVST